jgi:hypothetical protein
MGAKTYSWLEGEEKMVAVLEVIQYPNCKFICTRGRKDD